MNTSVSFNRTVIVSILLATSFVTVLNQTLLIIAIPPIMIEFQIEANQAQWITTAFMLTNGILIPITAFLIDKFTTRQLLISAISFFMIGTFLGAIAPNFLVLLLGRIVQAFGAGIMMPLSQTIILTLYPLEKRGAAMGMVGLVVGFAPAIGPTLSGFIIEQLSWRYLFYTILPFSFIVLILAFLFMKNVTKQREVKIDIASIIFSSFGWGGLLYGFSIAGSQGWVSPIVLGSIFVGAVSLFLFIRRQLSLEQPILEFRVFTSKIFTITTILSIVFFTLMIGTQTILPIYAQHIRDASALESGLMLLPGALIMGVMSPVTGRIFDKLGARALAITGFSLLLLAMTLFTFLQMESSLLFIAVVFTISMLGNSMLMMPMMTAGINALQQSLIAHGTAMHNTIRTVGGSIGTALLITVMSVTSMNVSIVDSNEAMLIGMKASFIVSAVIALVGLLLAFKISSEK